MENLLLIIKKAPLVTWKAFLVLWALFLGFADLMIKLTIKILKLVGQLSNSPVGVGTFTMSGGRSIDDGFSEKESDWRYDYPTKRDNYKPYQ